MFIISKDKAIGAIIMIVSVLIFIIYSLGSIVDLYLQTWGVAIGDAEHGFHIEGLPDIFDWRLFVVGPLWLLVLLICFVALWIGYSMLTTPAPVPLEELEEELAAEEAAEESNE